jgi:hypothetical protein
MEAEKKLTAAIAAVLYYIETEEEAVATQRANWEKTLPTMQMNPWSASGRQAQMQMRNLMQMKTFNRK